MKILHSLRRVAAALFLAAVVAAPALADETFDLRRPPKEGVNLTFALTAEFDFGGMTGKFLSDLGWKVLKVESDGRYRVETQMKGGRLDMGGQDMEMPEQPASTLVFGPRGELIELIGEGTGADELRFQSLNMVVAPEKPVAVGDKWTYEIKGDSKKGSVDGVANYELAAVETVGGVRVLKITFNYKETKGDKPASSAGTFWVTADDNLLFRMEAQYTNAPVGGAPEPVDMKVTIERKK